MYLTAAHIAGLGRFRAHTDVPPGYPGAVLPVHATTAAAPALVSPARTTAAAPAPRAAVSATPAQVQWWINESKRLFDMGVACNRQLANVNAYIPMLVTALRNGGAAVPPRPAFTPPAVTVTIPEGATPAQRAELQWRRNLQFFDRCNAMLREANTYALALSNALRDARVPIPARPALQGLGRRWLEAGWRDWPVVRLREGVHIVNAALTRRRAAIAELIAALRRCGVEVTAPSGLGMAGLLSGVGLGAGPDASTNDLADRERLVAEIAGKLRLLRQAGLFVRYLRQRLAQCSGREPLATRGSHVSPGGRAAVPQVRVSV